MIVAIPKDEFTLDNEARSIAAIIAETQLDQRRELMLRVALHLKRHNQSGTANLIVAAAMGGR